MVQKLLCLVGPTAAGKSAVALTIAHELEKHGCNAAIINADSRQIYTDFPRITAQPSKEEQSLFPHLLYGYLPTTEKSTAAAWAQRAAQTIQSCHAQSMVPILTGGTGFYFRALLSGLAEIPPVPQAISAQLKEEARKHGAPAMHGKLASIDPVMANRLHPNDTQRILRALEVWESTGKTLSAWQQEKTVPFLPPMPTLTLGIGPNIQEIRSRSLPRIHTMLQNGALEEARQAWATCPDPAAPGWSGIGCAELLAYMQGTLSLENAVALWDANTKAYAKRQLTWFRADANTAWFHAQETERIIQHIGRFLFGSP